MNEMVLKIENLHVTYGPIEAIKGVSMEVGKGKIVAILGANGAGKSTIIKTVNGLNKPSAGVIQFEDVSIGGNPPNKIAQKGIITSPEGRQILGDLTVEENLLVGTYSLKKRVKNLRQEMKVNFAKVYELFPLLHERRKQRASTLSGGEQQMLAIGRALMGSPKLLLLDEPSLGLAPLIIQNIFAVIQKIAEDGTSVFIVEQNALQTLKIADYAYLLELGKVKIEGVSSELLQNDELISAYLGGKKEKEEKYEEI